MMNSKTTDEMIRERNSLIVQAKETVTDTRKQKGVAADAAAIYAQVLEFGSARAEKMPEYRVAFQPLFQKYDCLAQNAQIKSGKIVDFLNELSALIFQDMRKMQHKRCKMR